MNASSQNEPRRYLITIGSPYCPLVLDGDKKLGRVDSDVQYIQELFCSKEKGYKLRFSSLEDDKNTITNKLTEFFSPECLKSSDSVIVYYAGHGSFDGRSNSHYLYARNTNRNNIAETAIETSSLVKYFFENFRLEELPSVLLILDVCYAGQGAAEAMSNFFHDSIQARDRANFWLIASSDSRTRAGDGAFVDALKNVMDDAEWISKHTGDFLSPQALVNKINESVPELKVQVEGKGQAPFIPLKGNSKIPKTQQGLDKYFRDIANSLKEGKLTIFLGSGINFSPNNSNENLPPSDIKIANYLAKNFKHDLKELIGLPCEVCPIPRENRPRDPGDPSKSCPIIKQLDRIHGNHQQLEYEQDLFFAKLAQRCWGQFIVTQHGDDSHLFVELKKILRNINYNPNKVQKNLSIIAANIENKKIKQKYNKLSQSIIVTTNYDIGLEKAFEEKGVGIDVVYYSIPNRFFYRKSYNPSVEIPSHETPSHNLIKFQCDENQGQQVSQEYKQLPLVSYQGYREISIVERPIILKLYGGVVYEAKREYDSFAITETHHTNVLNSLHQCDQLIPEELCGYLQNSDILFIGYSANDADLRAILDCLFDEKPPRWSKEPEPNRSEFKGWLLNQSAPGRISDTEYWEHWGIKLIDVYSWDDFMTQFQEYLSDNLLKA